MRKRWKAHKSRLQKTVEGGRRIVEAGKEKHGCGVARKRKVEVGRKSKAKAGKMDMNGRWKER